jgi:hypothetical protein
VFCKKMYAAAATLRANKNTASNEALLRLLEASLFTIREVVAFSFVLVLEAVEDAAAGAVSPLFSFRSLSDASLSRGCDFVSLNDFRNEFPMSLPPLVSIDDDASDVCKLSEVFSFGFFVAVDAAADTSTFVFAVDDPPLAVITSSVLLLRDFFFFVSSSLSEALDGLFFLFAMAY